MKLVRAPKEKFNLKTKEKDGLEIEQHKQDLYPVLPLCLLTALNPILICHKANKQTSGKMEQKAGLTVLQPAQQQQSLYWVPSAAQKPGSVSLLRPLMETT